MLLIQLLTVAPVVIHIGNKVYIQSINQHIVYLERKAHGTTKSPFFPNIYLQYHSIIND